MALYTNALFLSFLVYCIEISKSIFKKANINGRSLPFDQRFWSNGNESPSIWAFDLQLQLQPLQFGQEEVTFNQQLAVR